MAAQTTAIETFQEIHGTARATAQQLLRQIRDVQDLLDANPQVIALAEAAEPGAIVGNTGLTKEAVLMGIALITSFLAYADSELAPGITIRQAVHRLS